jgi:hypothetical protein
MSNYNKFEEIVLPKDNCERINNSEYKFFFYKLGNIRIVEPIGVKSMSNISCLCYNNKLYFSIRRLYSFEDHGIERKHVVIYCYDSETDKFIRSTYYKSFSDGGFWRYCIKRKNKNEYEKGYDYISSSFINIYLQNYIDVYSQDFVITIRSFEGINCNEPNSLNENIYKRIINKNTHENLFFNNIHDIFPEPGIMINEYDICIRKLKDEIKLSKNNNSKSKFSLLESLLLNIRINVKFKELNFNSPNYDRRSFFKNIMKAIYDLFFVNFELFSSTRKAISQKTFIVNSIKYLGVIYSIEILDKSSNQYYILYYMKYFNYKTSINYTIIIHIVPKESEINKYGLDDIYISGGVLIPKIYDYKKQSEEITELRNNINNEYNIKKYNFIGDIFDCSEYFI